MTDVTTIERLSQFRDAIIIPLANTDADKWPIRSGRVGRLILDQFSRQFFDDVELLRQQGVTDNQIATLFGNPSRLWRMSHHLLTGLRMLGTSLETQQQGMLTLLDLIGHLKYGGPFCTDGKNIIWTPTKVEGAATMMQPADSAEVVRLIHQLAAVLWSYAETLYFVAHELSVEIHGPYGAPDGSNILVRDFFNLQPSALWPTTEHFVPYKNIQIITAYQKFAGQLDVYNNLYLNTGFRLPDQTTAYAVLIDGNTSNIVQIRELLEQTSAVIQSISKLVGSWSLEEIARHYVHIFWWRKAELRQAAGQNWQPSDDVLKRIVADQIPDPSSSNPSLEDLRNKFDLTK